MSPPVTVSYLWRNTCKHQIRSRIIRQSLKYRSHFHWWNPPNCLLSKRVSREKEREIFIYIYSVYIPIGASPAKYTYDTANCSHVNWDLSNSTQRDSPLCIDLAPDIFKAHRWQTFKIVAYVKKLRNTYWVKYTCVLECISTHTLSHIFKRAQTHNVSLS